MRTRLPLLALLTLTACGGGSAAPQPDGPVVMGVIAGDHQVVPAARDAALPKPVDVQVYRGPNGQVSLRVLDLLLPAKAYAQTTVQGIPGQVVCFSAPDPKHALRAEVLCANSDALGHATFVVHSDTVAGVARGEVAAALATGTKITDSVSATVMPGAAAVWIPANGNTYFTTRAGSSFSIRDSITNVWDRYNNPLARTAYLVRYRRINNDASLTDPALLTGDTPAIRVGDAILDIAIDSARAQYPIHLAP